MKKEQLKYIKLFIQEAWDDFYQVPTSAANFKQFLLERLDKHIKND